MPLSLKCTFYHSGGLQRGEALFSIGAPHAIMWAYQSGGCVVPLPSVVYNRKTETTERFLHHLVENQLYQFCGVNDDGNRRTYHGVYRCIGVIPVDWEQLVSRDKVVSITIPCCRNLPLTTWL